MGHTDWLTFLSHEALPQVSQDHFEKALAKMQELLQHVNSHFHGPEVSLDILEPIDGADKLISYIRAGRKAELAEIEAIL